MELLELDLTSREQDVEWAEQFLLLKARAFRKIRIENWTDLMVADVRSTLSKSIPAIGA